MSPDERATFGTRLGLAAPIERVYAATTAFAADVWIAAATALSPDTSPLRKPLALGALVRVL